VDEIDFENFYAKTDKAHGHILELAVLPVLKRSPPISCRNLDALSRSDLLSRFLALHMISRVGSLEEAYSGKQSGTLNLWNSKVHLSFQVTWTLGEEWRGTLRALYPPFGANDIIPVSQRKTRTIKLRWHSSQHRHVTHASRNVVWVHLLSY